MREGNYCFWHSPARRRDAQEARRLGGLRRQRERTVGTAFDFRGLGSVTEIRRLLEVGVVDTLALENSIARTRTLISLALASIRLLEVGELETRLKHLEQLAVTPNHVDTPA
jgi:hypothetical protein